MGFSEKVYAIVVAYNPDHRELEKAVTNIKEQGCFVVVCNNSVEEFFFEASGVKVMNFGDNLGIAKAQSVGMKWAFAEGADFVLQVDQDSVLEKHTVSTLINGYKELVRKGYSVGVIGPKHYDKITKEVDEARLIKGRPIEGGRFTIVNATISSGSLIPKLAFDNVGAMEDGLFIDSVDFEYCWRLKKYGMLTVRDNQVMLGHRVGNGKKRIVGKIDARVPTPIRHYYHIRNLFLLTNRKYVPTRWKVVNFLKLFFKLAFYPLIFDDGAKRFKYLALGVKDGILRKYGRIDKASRGKK